MKTILILTLLTINIAHSSVPDQSPEQRSNKGQWAKELKKENTIPYECGEEYSAFGYGSHPFSAHAAALLGRALNCENNKIEWRATHPAFYQKHPELIPSKDSDVR